MNTFLKGCAVVTGFFGGAFLLLVIVMTFLVSLKPDHNSSSEQTTYHASNKTWTMGHHYGVFWTIYMSPEGIADEAYVKEVVQKIIVDAGHPRIIQINIFDDPSFVADDVPMTDDEMLHWKLNYGRNLNTGYEDFQYVNITKKDLE